MTNHKALTRVCAMLLLALPLTTAPSEAASITIALGDINPAAKRDVTGISELFDINVLLTGAVFSTTLSSTEFDLANGNKFQADSANQTFSLTPGCGVHFLAGCDIWFLAISGEEVDASNAPIPGGFTLAFLGNISFEEFITGTTTAFIIRNTTGQPSLLDDDVVNAVTFTNSQLTVTTVPEPGTLLLLASGTAVIMARRRNRRSPTSHR